MAIQHRPAGRTVHADVASNDAAGLAARQHIHQGGLQGVVGWKWAAARPTSLTEHSTQPSVRSGHGTQNVHSAGISIFSHFKHLTLPAPEAPISAVRIPGRKEPLQVGEEWQQLERWTVSVCVRPCKH